MITKPAFDVLLVDVVGAAFNQSFLADRGMGGSEFQAVMLLEELAKRGYRCGCVNRGPLASVSSSGVHYFPLVDLNSETIRPKTDVLISMRHGSLPVGIEFERCVFWIHDVPDGHLRTVHAYLEQMQAARVVCVSSWQRSRCPADWEERSEVIPDMLPDWVYEYPSRNRDQEKFVYASAAIKGLDATLEVWSRLKKKHRSLTDARLEVLSPGYDAPSSDRMEGAEHVHFRGSLPFAMVVEELATARALFYVNTFPETFCIVAAICGALKTDALVLCVNEQAAITETMGIDALEDEKSLEKCIEIDSYPRPKCIDFRASTVVPQWIKILELQ